MGYNNDGIRIHSGEGKMKRTIVIILILFCGFPVAAETDCFTVIVGKEATADGSVILAHNEDDAGKHWFLDIHQVKSRFPDEIETITLKNGARLPQVKKTFGYLWLQLPGFEFGDSYFTENSVVIVSNQCPSREKKGELSSGGIGFLLRRLVAQRALSARHAVEIAGRLIDRYGYYSSGRTLCIADEKEGWLLHLVRGKHWMARRVPDDEVAVIPNYYTIGKIDLGDPENFLGSPDLIRYAREKGWYDPEEEGEFDFSRAYSDPDNRTSRKNTLRHWRGADLLAEENYGPDNRLPFSFKPRKKLRVPDLFRVLRDHYEGTEYDLTDNYRNGSPNFSGNRTICTASTRYSVVAHIRQNLPKEISGLVWIAFGRPDSNAYSPWYFPITPPPDGYNRTRSDKALATHFTKPRSYFQYNPRYAVSQFARLSDLVDQDYKNRIKITRKAWDNFENYVFRNFRKKEKEFHYLYKQNRIITTKIITNHVHNLEYRRWYLADELIRQWSGQ